MSPDLDLMKECDSVRTAAALSIGFCDCLSCHVVFLTDIIIMSTFRKGADWCGLVVSRMLQPVKRTCSWGDAWGGLWHN